MAEEAKNEARELIDEVVGGEEVEGGKAVSGRGAGTKRDLYRID